MILIVRARMAYPLKPWLGSMPVYSLNEVDCMTSWVVLRYLWTLWMVPWRQVFCSKGLKVDMIRN